MHLPVRMSVDTTGPSSDAEIRRLSDALSSQLASAGNALSRSVAHEAQVNVKSHLLTP